MIGCGQKNNNIKNDMKTTKFSLEDSLLSNDYVKIQMTKSAAGHLHLKGILNGIEGDFILDTGAGATVIEQNRKEKFIMQSKASNETATGAGGTDIVTQESDGNELIIGDTLKLSNTLLYLMSLDHINIAYKSIGITEIDGIIGADILTNNEAIIDYSNLVLYLKE